MEFEIGCEDEGMFGKDGCGIEIGWFGMVVCLFGFPTPVHSIVTFFVSVSSMMFHPKILYLWATGECSVLLLLYG